VKSISGNTFSAFCQCCPSLRETMLYDINQPARIAPDFYSNPVGRDSTGKGNLIGINPEWSQNKSQAFPETKLWIQIASCIRLGVRVRRGLIESDPTCDPVLHKHIYILKAGITNSFFNRKEVSIQFPHLQLDLTVVVRQRIALHDGLSRLKGSVFRLHKQLFQE
jgi:hypothetical protein